MITASENLKNIFKNNTTIKSGIAATIEYNMNSMIDGITVTSATEDSSYINGISQWDTTNKANPFKKLFPVDSIIKPFRPLYPGVKYYILSTTDTPANSFLPFRTIKYTGEGKNIDVSGAKPRVYYPGLTTSYKYWVSAKDQNVDLTVTYKQATVISGNKSALANKIVIKFEKNHVLPSQYKVIITPTTGSAIVKDYATPPSNGIINLYYNGTNWNTTTEPSSYSTPQQIKSIQLQATNSSGIVGVIEISARWVKDVSSDLVSMIVTKDSSSSSEDLLPVGTLTANGLSMELSNYNNDSLKSVEYVRNEVELDSSLTYYTKNIEIKPSLIIYHENGALGTSPNKYDKIPQGVYYLDSYNITQYGEVSLDAIDGAKYLMDTLCPDLLCESFPVTAIIRNLLDVIGFTNYNFNLVDNETSVPQVRYWWTEDTKTVWETIQELCRDIQMNAVFDENNILQFYSRDYIYSSSRSIDWNFYNDAEGSILPNIIDFNKKEIASANHVKVIWKSPLSSNYTGSSDYLWQSPSTYISAGALKEDLAIDGEEFIIELTATDIYGQQQSFYNFSGYVLIDAEIIEFDAMGYDYTPLDNDIKLSIWIESESDVNKYRALAKPGYEIVNSPTTSYFKPNGKYRIKKDSNNMLIGRGALGTVASAHQKSVSKLSGWTGKLVTFS